jgi:hypothetical protein
MVASDRPAVTCVVEAQRADFRQTAEVSYSNYCEVEMSSSLQPPSLKKDNGVFGLTRLMPGGFSCISNRVARCVCFLFRFSEPPS